MNSRNSFSSLTITQLVIHLTGALLDSTPMTRRKSKSWHPATTTI